MSDQVLPDFDRIYAAYHAKVVAYAARLIGREEADDVAQEVFVKVGRGLHSLSDASKLASWIHAITLNTVRDVIRSRCSTVERRAAPLDAAREDGDARTRLPIVADPAARTPEEAAIRREMVACFLDYVNQLPASYHEVYVLTEFDGLSNEEIARRLSLSPGTVKIRLHRARARLNDELRPNCRCYHNERGELMGTPKKP